MYCGAGVLNESAINESAINEFATNGFATNGFAIQDTSCRHHHGGRHASGPTVVWIGAALRKCQRTEARLRKAGLPAWLSRAPAWLLCLYYCNMMRGKTARIAAVSQRICRWLETIAALSQHDRARTELIDIDSGMRNDIEATKRTLLQLRALCAEVGTLFGSLGFDAAVLDRTQQAFLFVVDDACVTATTLQRALEVHDLRALMLLRECDDAERARSSPPSSPSALPWTPVANASMAGSD
jgi:hypothetical protein